MCACVCGGVYVGGCVCLRGWFRVYVCACVCVRMLMGVFVCVVVY